MKGEHGSEGEVAGVRCCNSDGGGNCQTPLECPDGFATYWQAVDICKAQGQRLCTHAEMASNTCCGTGGECDKQLNWVLSCSDSAYSKFSLAHGKWYHTSDNDMTRADGEECKATSERAKTLIFFLFLSPSVL